MRQKIRAQDKTIKTKNTAPAHTDEESGKFIGYIQSYPGLLLCVVDCPGKDHRGPLEASVRYSQQLPFWI
jgi:hypothetical protein